MDPNEQLEVFELELAGLVQDLLELVEHVQQNQELLELVVEIIVLEAPSSWVLPYCGGSSSFVQLWVLLPGDQFHQGRHQNHVGDRQAGHWVLVLLHLHKFVWPQGIE